jgi:hypothetical protein
MRTISTLAMRTLRVLARAILSFTMLPIRVAVVESQWVAGSNLGRNPGDDIDRDIESFARRKSGNPRTQDTRDR